MTDDPQRRAATALDLGHIYGLKAAEVNAWSELPLTASQQTRLAKLQAAFRSSGSETGDEATCDAYRRIERILAASRYLQCADVDYDTALAEHSDHLKRGARTLIARASRLPSTGGTPDQLEGLRVEILSYRDRLPATGNDWRIARERLGAAALKLRQHNDHARTQKPASTALEQLADFDERPDTLSCSSCGQTFIPHTGSTRCQTCDNADTDQGDQLGMFEIPATAAKPRKTTRSPQPEGLFA